MSVLDKAPLSANRHRAVLRALLLSTALTSVGGAAFAADKTKETTTAADAPAVAAAPTGLGEVVVTARKREENLQTVPVSATVLSSAALTQQNLTNIYDLRGAIPDLNLGLSQGGSGVNLVLRGVGQGQGGLVQNSAKVGLYLDEMFVARPEGNSLYFYDQGAFQVLYGPQGTLFGRNTSGGAVLITTNRPSANGPSYVQATLGNYRTINTEGGINIPVSDTLLTRVSFRTQKSDGYITHVLDSDTSDNINDQSIRGQVRWLPTTKFTVDMLYEHDHSRTNGTGVSVFKGCTNAGFPESSYNQLYVTPYCSLYTVLPKQYQVYGGSLFQGPTSTLQTPLYTGGDYTQGQLTQHYRGGPFNAVDVDTANLRLTYDLSSDVTLHSVTTYRHSHARDFSPLITTPIVPYEQYNDQGTQATSEDVNLNYKGFDNRLRVTIGGYYYNQVSKSLQFDGTDYCDPAGWDDREIDKERSYAAYGQASFDVTPELELTAGARYTHDYKYALGAIQAWNEAGAIPGCATYVQAFQGGIARCANTLIASNSNVWTNFNPMASIRYKITPDVNLYATIRTSYDQGGFNAHSLSTRLTNQPINGVANPFRGTLGQFDPDHFTDYEGGVKTEFFNHTLRVNVDVYYQKYTALVSTVVITINGIPTRNSQNAGDAHFDGVEASLEWAPTRDLLLSANGSLVRAKYDSILPAAISTTFNLATPLVGVQGSPKSTYSLSGSYTFHPHDTSELIVSVNYKHQGSTLSCQVGANYTCQVPAYGLLGGRVSFQPSNDSPWTASIFVTNLANSYWLYGKNVLNPLSPGMGIASDTPGAPREFGLTIKRTF
jgi:iron complex outermembrane receptor protein